MIRKVIKSLQISIRKQMSILKIWQRSCVELKNWRDVFIILNLTGRFRD
jgi:hypothetical protein